MRCLGKSRPIVANPRSFSSRATSDALAYLRVGAPDFDIGAANGGEQLGHGELGVSSSDAREELTAVGVHRGGILKVQKVPSPTISMPKYFPTTVLGR